MYVIFELMSIIFWIAYCLTVAEFIASPVNTLMGSKMHLQRLKEARFPLSVARVLAIVELVAVIGVFLGIWIASVRLVGGLILAACFVPILVQAIRVKRPMGDLLALAFFIACAVLTALY